MGVIKTWNTVYPVAIDDLVTNFPVLVDATDEVIASHSNELAKAVVALETEQQAIVTTVSGLGNIQALYNSVSQTTTLRSINFTGSGVSVSTVGNAVTVTVNTSTTDRYSDTIIVGNSAAGDTTATCHYLETGTGAAIVSALTAAGALSPPGNVFIRRGTYTVTAQTGAIVIPTGVRVAGADKASTTFTCRTTGNIALFSLQSASSLENISIAVPPAALGASLSTFIVELDRHSTVKNVDVNLVGSANSPVCTVFGYNKVPYPEGIYCENITINMMGSSIPAGVLGGFKLISSTPGTYSNPDRQNVLKDIVVNASDATAGSATAAFVVGTLGLTVENCKSVGCTLYSTATIGTLGSSIVSGPWIKNCTADLTGLPAGANHAISLQHVCYAGTVLGGGISDCYITGDASSTSVSKSVLINPVPTSSTVTYAGFSIRNVSSKFSTTGAGGIDVLAGNNATLTNFEITNCYLGSGDCTISCTATSYNTNHILTNLAGRNFSLAGTTNNISGLVVNSHRFTGTYTTLNSARRVVGRYVVDLASNLPNVSGSPTQTTLLNAGDEAYVTATSSSYVCTTATAGSAIWAPIATVSGQLGGTAASPDVRGIRETSGPTLLTFGSITDGQTLVRSGSTVVGVPSAVPTSFYFIPGSVSPPPGAYTSWSALMAAISTLRLTIPTAKVTVTVDGSAVGGVVDVPSGTYDWTNIEFVGAAYEVLNFKAGASVTQFNQVIFRYLQLQTDATIGSPAFVTSAVSTWSIYFYGTSAYDLGAGYIPLLRAESGTGGMILQLYEGGCLYQSGGTASAVAVATGGTIYVNIFDSGYVESRCIASTNPSSVAWFTLLSPAAMDAGTSNWLDSHPIWTSGTITTALSSVAKYVQFTPTGTVAATNVQAAIAEVDSEKAAISGGQLGGTGAAPDVRGIRETSGPTLLTIGAVADGQVLVRSGTTVVGTTVSTGPSGTMVKPNLRLAGASPTTAPSAVVYRDIAWSQSLGLFCAVGASGAILTSPDGITWTVRTSGTVYNLTGVCWAAGLGLFIACGADSGAINTEIRTSPDGITWTQRYASAAPLVFGIATNTAGTTVIAYGTQGLMLSSTNGTSWTSRTSQFSTDTIMQAAWNGTLFVAVGGAGKVSTSPDGITWTARTSGTANGLIGVASNPSTGRTVATGGLGTVLTSADGITWGTTNTLVSLGTGNIIQIGFGDGAFIVGPLSSGTSCWASPDGINWSIRSFNTGLNYGTNQPTRGAVYGTGRYVWPASSAFASSDSIT